MIRPKTSRLGARSKIIPTLSTVWQMDATLQCEPHQAREHGKPHSEEPALQLMVVQMQVLGAGDFLWKHMSLTNYLER